MEEQKKEWYVVNTYSGHELAVKQKLEMRTESMGMQDYIFRVIIPETTEVEVKDGVKKFLKRKISAFQRDKSTISRHIKIIFTEGELQRDSVVANFATTAADGKTYQVDYYNLDVIISV